MIRIIGTSESSGKSVKWIAGTTSGKILKLKTKTGTFVEGTSPFSTNSIKSLVYDGNNDILGSSTNGVVATSIGDGTGWNQRSAGFGTQQVSDVWAYKDRAWQSLTNTLESPSAVAHGNGRFVIGKSTYGILSSTDGATWTTSNRASYSSFIFFNNKFIGTTGSAIPVLMSSTDGISWTTSVSISFMNPSASVSLFSAGSRIFADNALYEKASSTDGISWSTTNIPYQSTVNMPQGAVEYINSRYIIPRSDRVIVSTDGVNWSINKFGFTLSYLTDLAYGQGKYIAVGGNTLDGLNGIVNITSTDLISWTTIVGSYVIGGSRANTITFFNNKWFMSHRPNFLTPSFSESTDGVTWTTVSALTYVGSTGYDKFVDSNGTTLIAADASVVYSSVDGITWTTRLKSAGFDYDGFHYMNNKWVGVTFNNLREVFSSDGTYEQTYSVSTAVQNKYICWANNRWVATNSGTGSGIYTSTDLVSWTTISHPEISQPSTTRSGAGLQYYASSINNQLIISANAGDFYLKSTDFISWSTIPVINKTDRRLFYNASKPFAYGQNKWLCIGQDNVFFSSTDSINWTKTFGTQKVDNYLSQVSYADGKWVAVGGYGSIDYAPQMVVSTDALSWQYYGYYDLPMHTGSRGLDFVDYFDNEWVAGQYMAFIKSTDALTWTRKDWPWGAGQYTNYWYGGVIDFQKLDEDYAYTRSYPDNGDNFIYSFIIPKNYNRIALSDSTVKISTDSVNWTTALSSTDTKDIWDRVTYSQSLSANNNKSIAYASGRSIISGDNGKLLFSPSGFLSNSKTLFTYGQRYRSIAVGANQWEYDDYHAVLTDGIFSHNNKWIISTQYNRATSNDDGETWTISHTGFDPITNLENADIGFGLRSFIHNNSTYYAVGPYGAATSTDLVSWTTVSTFTGLGGGVGTALAFSGSRWVAGGGVGRLTTSTDFVTWTTVVAPNVGSATILRIVYQNNLWIAMSASGANSHLLSYSTDAVTWTTVTSVTDQTMYDIEYIGGRYLGVGNYNTIRSSTDLVTWTTVLTGSSSATSRLYAINQYDGKYVALGSHSKISTDSITWTSTIYPLNINSAAAVNTGTGTIIADGYYQKDANRFFYTIVKNSPVFGSGNINFVSDNRNETVTAVIDKKPVSFGMRFGGPYASLSEYSVLYPWNGDFYPELLFSEARSSTGFASIIINGNTILADGHVSYDKGITWQDRANADPFDARSISYANGLFFHAPNNQYSANTYLHTSTDLISWTTYTGLSNIMIGKVVHTGSRYIASTALNSSLYSKSTDGISWTTSEYSIPLAYSRVESLRYLNGKWVQVSSGNKQNGDNNISYSTDGYSWLMPHTAPMTYSGTALDVSAYGNGKWAFAGVNNSIVSSTDLVSWEASASFSGQILYDMAFGNGKFVAVGSAGRCMTSTDAINWTTATVNFGTTAIYEVVYGDKWVIMGNSGQGRTSTDAVTWTTVTTGTTTNIRGLQYLSTATYKYVMGNTSGWIRGSTDGITWSSTVFTNTITDMTAGRATTNGNKLVMAGDWDTDGKIFTYSSVDGITWTTGIIDATHVRTNRDFITEIDYDGSKWLMAVGAEGKYYSSTDAINWTIEQKRIGHNRAKTNSVSVLKKLNGAIWAAGEYGALASSSDGISWTPSAGRSDQIANASLGYDRSITSMTYGGGKYIAVGYDGLIISSTDGNSWSKPSLPNTLEFERMAYMDWFGVEHGDGIFVVVGGTSYSAALMFSTDAISWEIGQTNGSIYEWYKDVKFDSSDNTFYTVGDITFIGKFNKNGLIHANKINSYDYSYKRPAYAADNGYVFLYQVGSTEPDTKGSATYTFNGPMPKYFERKLPTSENIQRVAYSNGNWIAIGTSTVFISQDYGVTWTTTSIGSEAASSISAIIGITE